MLDLSQWIQVPDDQSTVDELEDIGGLKNFLDDTGDRIEYGYNEPSLGGLLLGPHYRNLPAEGIDTIDFITLSGLFPPPLSPDSSPASNASSTPWLRTPITDPSFNHTPADVPWDIVEAEEPCSAIHLVDQSGNSLEDISQIYDLRPEDIACTPQNMSDVPLPMPAPYESLGPATPIPFSTPIIFVNSPLPSVLTYPQTEAELPEATQCTSLSPSPSSPYIPQNLLGARYSREEPQPQHLAAPQLMLPPIASRDPSPLFNFSAQSPSHSSVPLFDSYALKATEPVPSASRRKPGSLREKRSAEPLDDDGAPLKMRRRSKAKDVDEEEWSPALERVKRSRAVLPSQTSRQRAASVPKRSSDEGSDPKISQQSDGYSEATNCRICGLEFSRTSDYVRHMENSSSHPETRRMWPCNFCDKTLGRRDALMRHVRTFHPGEDGFSPEGVHKGDLSTEAVSVQRVGQRKVPSKRRAPRRNLET